MTGIDISKLLRSTSIVAGSLSTAYVPTQTEKWLGGVKSRGIFFGSDSQARSTKNVQLEEDKTFRLRRIIGSGTRKHGIEVKRLCRRCWKQWLVGEWKKERKRAREKKECFAGNYRRYVDKMHLRQPLCLS